VVFYSNSSSLESGLITVFRNRLGDVFFLLSFLFFYLSGRSSFDFFSYDFLCFFVFLVFFGSITKRAQVPFSAWLPAAMAAPTPVSSLVHSSTLVTAGVYVLIRFNYIFFYYDFFFMKFLFLFTMVLAGFCAVLEKDFKKVVAISTLSQLGMMVFVLSIGLWVLSFIHIIIHAFFKSILFLRTGSIISQVRGLQDSRFYGGVHFSFGSFVYFVVRCFCLSGFPFFVGFYSKDFIISSSSSFSGTLYYYVFIIGCLFTVFYRIRLVYEGFINTFSRFSFMRLNEASYFFIPVIFLFFNCWLLGGMFYWVFLVDLTFFFLWSDLLFGVVLIFVGGFLTFYLSFSYYLSFSFFRILFLRWGFNGGTSFFNKRFFLAGFERTWMEVFGGIGTYRSFLNLNCFLFSLEMLSLGLVIFVRFVVLFFLFLV
jgi:NADH-ubiquinone oxidoreductase chain 5